MAPSFQWLWESIIMAELSEFTAKSMARCPVIITQHDFDMLFWASWINTLANWWTGLMSKMSICCPTLCTLHALSANETAPSTSKPTAWWSNWSSWILLPLIVASTKDLLHDLGRQSPLSQSKLPLIHIFPMIRAIKAQALLPVLPWMFDWDSVKVQSTTPAMYEEGLRLPLINPARGIPIGDGCEVDGGTFGVQGSEPDMFSAVSSELVWDCWQLLVAVPVWVDKTPGKQLDASLGSSSRKFSCSKGSGQLLFSDISPTFKQTNTPCISHEHTTITRHTSVHAPQYTIRSHLNFFNWRFSFSSCPCLPLCVVEHYYAPLILMD